MIDQTDPEIRFLAQAGWENCLMQPIVGDASPRQYMRLFHQKTNKTAILMNAPPSRNNSMKPFVDIAAHLTGLGLSAPHIYSHDLDNGLVLLEDLGDGLFARVVAQKPEREPQLYEAAIEVISALHAQPGSRPMVPAYDASTMAESTDLAFLFYAKTVRSSVPAAAQDAMQTIENLLFACDDFDKLSLRDFHAENLLWMPERPGVACVGLLDFQDAVMTHPAYDLMSLLRDARRDVTPDVADRMITLFCEKQGYDEPRFRAEAALISTQRNLRILGIFARLSRLYQKPHYIDLIPRVWGHLQTDLKHPTLDGLREQLMALLPEPTTSFLNHLRTPCPTPQ